MSSTGSPEDKKVAIARLEPLVRRVIRNRVGNADVRDDLVQETLSRVLGVCDRLDRSVLPAYAVATARNLVQSYRRTEASRLGKRHLLVDLRQPITPEEQTLRIEEQAAVQTALSRLGERDREVIAAFEHAEATLKSVARRMKSSPGAVATRLARARARLRVEYLLVSRNAVPSARCREILVALSSGDTRRQMRLAAGDHVSRCALCCELAPLVTQRGRVPVWVAIPLLGRAFGKLRETVSGHPVPALAIGAAAVVVTISLLLPAGDVDLVINGEPIFPLDGESLGGYSGKQAEARAVRVESVPSDEGFWVGRNRVDRLFVELSGVGESSEKVVPGMRVSFEGVLLPIDEDTVVRNRMPPEEAQQLLGQRHYIAVQREQLRIKSSAK